MRRSRFSEEQIIRVLQEAQAGEKPQEVCRRQGISPGTLYRWKAQYGGVQVKVLSETKERRTPHEAAGGGEPEAEAALG